jgi:hypothetical protein
MTARALAFREWFGLERATADLLAVLFQAGGQSVDRHAAARAAGLSPGAIVSYHIPAIRGAMETEAVDCNSGQGYRLSEIGMDECQKALQLMSEEYARRLQELKQAS